MDEDEAVLSCGCRVTFNFDGEIELHRCTPDCPTADKVETVFNQFFSSPN